MDNSKKGADIRRSLILINSHDKEKEKRKAHLDGTDKSHQKKSCAYYMF